MKAVVIIEAITFHQHSSADNRITPASYQHLADGVSIITEWCFSITWLIRPLSGKHTEAEKPATLLSYKANTLGT